MGFVATKLATQRRKKCENHHFGRKWKSERKFVASSRPVTLTEHNKARRETGQR